MHNRKAGFTIIELLIVVVVIAILASIAVVAYNGIVVSARSAAAQSDLQSAATQMQVEYIDSGNYPSEIPETVHPSESIELVMRWSGTFTSYTNLTAVQNGVLLSQICQDLINEGLGRGVNQGGQTQNYITGCGNWNRGSVQVTAWDSRVWNTPVTSEQLLNYANTFTTADTWNNSQIATVRTFYTQLVERQVAMGGSFPITSFWDSWANPSNGGTMYQALPSQPQTITSYCIEATIENVPDKIWHINQNGVTRDGPCQR